MKYLLVHWSETNNTSIMEENCLKDVSLMKNANKQGMIFHKDLGIKKAPKGGWKAYLGRVISVHDSVKQARSKETEFLNEDKENTPQTVPKKRKHDVDSESDQDDDGSDDEYCSKQVEILPIKQRKKMAMISAEKDILKRVASQVTPVESEEELDDLSRKELIAKVRMLQKKLDFEKSKRQLCNELPKMLVDALGNSIVLEKLSRYSTGLQPKATPKFVTSIPKPKSAFVHQTPPKQILERSGGFTVAPSESNVIVPGSHTPPALTCGLPSSPVLQDYSQFDVNKVHSLLLPSAKMEVDRAKNYSKLTKTLVGSFFDRLTLQNSTLAGKRKDGGQVLDAEKVELIIGYVCKSYPFVTRAAVRNAISQKIKDEKEACKRKAISER